MRPSYSILKYFGMKMFILSLYYNFFCKLLSRVYVLLVCLFCLFAFLLEIVNNLFICLHWRNFTIEVQQKNRWISTSKCLKHQDKIDYHKLCALCSVMSCITWFICSLIPQERPYRHSKQCSGFKWSSCSSLGLL